MLALGHFGDQLLDHDVDHGPGGKAEQVGQGRHHQPGGPDGKQCAHRLHSAGQRTRPERPAAAHALGFQRHRNDSALGEVLDGDAKGKRQCPHGRDGCTARYIARIDYTDGHALGDVVQRDGQHQHRGAGKAAVGAFGGIGTLVQMRHRHIQQQQKADTQPKADGGRDKRQPPHAFGLLHGRDEQAPDRRRHHDPGGKAG